MTSSLIPEKPLLFSPSLAATIGLEEAIMLSALNEVAQHRSGTYHNGYQWRKLDAHGMETLLPFWAPQDLQRVAKSLRDKGIILIESPPYTECGHLLFAFNETERSATR